jgi:hypothetical protein
MQNKQSAGRENGKGFTPKGERHLPPSDVAHLIPCQLTGKDYTRPTIIYVEPVRLGRAIDKYQKLGVCIVYPPSAREHLVNYVAIPVAPRPAGPRRKGAIPIICLTNGKFYGSTKEAGDFLKMFPQAISIHLKGAPHAKGYRFRYATDEEIERHDADPASWAFDEPLLPNLKPKKD